MASSPAQVLSVSMRIGEYSQSPGDVNVYKFEELTFSFVHQSSILSVSSGVPAGRSIDAAQYSAVCVIRSSWYHASNLVKALQHIHARNVSLKCIISATSVVLPWAEICATQGDGTLTFEPPKSRSFLQWQCVLITPPSQYQFWFVQGAQDYCLSCPLLALSGGI